MHPHTLALAAGVLRHDGVTDLCSERGRLQAIDHLARFGLPRNAAAVAVLNLAGGRS